MGGWVSVTYRTGKKKCEKYIASLLPFLGASEITECHHWIFYHYHLPIPNTLLGAVYFIVHGFISLNNILSHLQVAVVDIMILIASDGIALRIHVFKALKINATDH